MRFDVSLEDVREFLGLDNPSDFEFAFLNTLVWKTQLQAYIRLRSIFSGSVGSLLLYTQLLSATSEAEDGFLLYNCSEVSRFVQMRCCY